MVCINQCSVVLLLYLWLYSSSRTHTHSQNSLDLGFRPNISPSHSPILSPQCLERPFDDRSHNRRPSDEAAIILRKISSSGHCGVSPYMFGNSLAVNMPENKTHSLPPGFVPNAMDIASFQGYGEMARMNQHQHTLGRFFLWCAFLKGLSKA